MTKDTSYEEFKKCIQYVSNYYDIPLSGAMIIDKEKAWFKCRSDTGLFILYDVYFPTKKAWEMIDYRHKMFQKYVGEHSDYINGEKDYTKIKPEKEWHKFYDNPPPFPELKKSWIKYQLRVIY